jgi:starch synthase
LRVLQVCAEIFPLLKTGGLADVAGALPKALMQAAPAGAAGPVAAAGNTAAATEVRVLLPGFAAILAGLTEVSDLGELHDHPGGAPARLLRGRLPAVAAPAGQPVVAYVIDAPALYQRPGGPYNDERGQAHGDNHRRFGLLGWTAAHLGWGVPRTLDAGWQADVVHAHDWHAALAPAYLAAARRRSHHAVAASVYTVHNLAYQGVFDAERFGDLGLPREFAGIDGLEFYGQINFMKAGLNFADHLTTVSPTYAREIQGEEQGCGLDGLLRKRSAQLSGILNGVDEAVWDPASDTGLVARYKVGRMAGKVKVKAALQAELGLAVRKDAPLFCVVSRLTEQKGLHLVQQVLPTLRDLGAQFALLGSGEPGLEAAFRAQAEAAPEQVAVKLGYDEAFAHRLVAASDFILVPSRFEPCGLTQLYGLKYGTLPIVRRVGGLADTVADSRLETLDSTATGFVFDSFSPAGLLAAIERGLALWRRPADWQQVQGRAMQMDSSWAPVARRYLALYAELQRQRH